LFYFALCDIFGRTPRGHKPFQRGRPDERTEKHDFGATFVAALAVYWGISAFASDYPAKPITLVIPYPAGGSTDLTGRALANAAKKYLGQPIIVENKSGGGRSDPAW
jgi:hypothetical protein